jgi:hypothetical protein
MEEAKRGVEAFGTRRASDALERTVAAGERLRKNVAITAAMKESQRRSESR